MLGWGWCKNGVTITAPQLLRRAQGQLLTVFHPSQVKFGEPLSRHTYIKTGGPADIAVFPTDGDQVRAAVLTAKQLGLRHWLLGNGSNILVRDGGLRGLTIILTGLSKMRRIEQTVVAQGGVGVIQLAQFALQHQLRGLEFACGIPGTVGAGIRMNAGAYGGQMSDVLARVRVMDGEGEEHMLSAAALGLTYRDSAVETRGWIVLEALFPLAFDDGKAIQERMDHYTHRRRSKQPLNYPSCGSVFKRPRYGFASQMIEESGLKGVRVGGAQVSTKHAGFIVNLGGASTSDYLALIHLVRTTVQKQHGVELELEVKVIGDELSPATGGSG